MKVNADKCVYLKKNDLPVIRAKLHVSLTFGKGNLSVISANHKIEQPPMFIDYNMYVLNYACHRYCSHITFILNFIFSGLMANMSWNIMEDTYLLKRKSTNF